MEKSSKLEILNFPEISPSERISFILREMSSDKTPNGEYEYLDHLLCALINFIDEIEVIEAALIVHDLRHVRNVLEIIYGVE